MRTRFIAEVSGNHQQDLDRCLDFIDVAAQIGCDGIQFQLFQLDKLFSPEVIARSKAHALKRNWELPLSFLPRIANHCENRKIRLGFTPLYLEAVEELLPYVDFFKISSHELQWEALLILCAQTGKPVLISTALATMEEVDNAVAVLQQNGCEDLTVLQCVSAFPAPLAECNLSVIDVYRNRYNVRVGWSDHSVSPAVMYRAVWELHSDVVEFHLDLDGDGPEYRAGHCWLPHEIAFVIRTVKEGQVAGGDGDKVPVPAELSQRAWRADPMDGLRPMRSLRKDWHP